MAPRASWKGHLQLSLVSVPVQAFNAAAGDGGQVHFNQLHAKCNSRIRYAKMCPVHGEVPNAEIVMGYEYAKDQYVVLEKSELAAARRGDERAIAIDTFIDPAALDPAYFDGRTYYLMPDGPAAQKPYAVLLKALEQEKQWAIAQAVLFDKEHLVAIRPKDRVLCMEVLYFHSQVRSADVVDGEFSLPAVSKEELKLAAKLIEASTKSKFDLAAYQDHYTDQMREVIEAKVAGKQLVAAPTKDDETPVINLMDALRKSVAQASSRRKPAAPATSPTGKPVRRRTPRRTA